MTYQQALLAHLLRTNEQQVASCDAFVALPSAETDAERAQWRERALARVREVYCWDTVSSSYEQLLRGLAG